MASASLLGTVGRTVAAAALHEQLVATLLGFLGSLSDQSQVGSLLLLVLLGTSTLQSDTDTLAHILGVAEVEELANLGGTLRPKTDGALDIGDTWQRGRAILDDHQVEHGQVLRHDAATDGLALHLTSATLTVALGALAEQQAHTLRGQDTLQHRETLLVVATGDLGAVSLELISQGVEAHLSGDPLVEERQKILVIVDVDGLLGTRLGAGNVELHCAEQQRECVPM